MSNESKTHTQTKTAISLTNIVLDSQFEAVFDAVTKLTAEQLDAPVALITFVDDESIWIHSQVGLPEPKVVPNKRKFCGIFPEDEEFYQISDTDLDATHKEHLFKIDGIKARFYAAARIMLPLGEMIGVLCVFDIKPRFLNHKQRHMLIGLAEVIEKILVTKSIKKRIS